MYLHETRTKQRILLELSEAVEDPEIGHKGDLQIFFENFLSRGAKPYFSLKIQPFFPENYLFLDLNR